MGDFLSISGFQPAHRELYQSMLSCPTCLGGGTYAGTYAGMLSWVW